MCKICWGLSGLLVVIIAALAYFFVLPGSAEKAEDGRTAIVLTPAERDMVLSEMRGFLETVQGITEGLADNDMEAIASSVRTLGAANAGGAPVSLMVKLPGAFRSLAMETHGGFDELAMEAEDMGDAQIVLGRLGDLMRKCTTCHAGYRFETERR
jgi:hypothetical protein